MASKLPLTSSILLSMPSASEESDSDVEGPSGQILNYLGQEVL